MEDVVMIAVAFYLAFSLCLVSFVLAVAGGFRKDKKFVLVGVSGFFVFGLVAFLVAVSSFTKF
ncbi:MAG: hypothetical protein IK005_10820 [Paludibacteraceae bacterium]|nr:hypothetical protein [Paludibacteraceae bacterium]